MSGWDPPQADARADIPVVPNKAKIVWRKRRYGRVPVWGWGVGGLAALLAIGALAPEDEDTAAAVADATAHQVEVVSTGAPEAAPTSVPVTTVIADVATTPAPTTDVAVTSGVVTTTSAPRTELVVVTLPPTTVPPPTTAAPTTTTLAPTTTTVPPTTTTAPPPPPSVAPQPFVPSGGCDPNYTGCVPIASDVDCAGGSGNGPAYADGPVQVIGSDIYGLDGDGDGVACE